MEHLHNGFQLELAENSFPLSTDSIALSGFVKLPKSARVLDLGSGCGTLGLLLCTGNSACSVTGIELSPEDHRMALHNAQANGISHRLTSVCADLRSIPTIFEPGSFQVCLSNPPYFTGGPRSPRAARARHTDSCSLEDLFSGAAWALQFGGDFFLVHKPQMLAEICHCACSHRLEPKTLCLLRHDPDSPVNLILLQCRKGAKPGLTVQEQFLRHSDGTPSPYYQALYHL